MKFFPSQLLRNYFLSFSGLPRACWHGIYLSFVESALGGICFFLSLYFVNVLHINIATAGLIISAYGVGRVVGGMLGGKLSDTFSAHQVSIGSLLLQGITYLALIKIKSVFWLIITIFFLGTEAYVFITANNTWVLEQCKESEHQRLKSINLLYTASNLGIGVAALITGMFAAYSFSLVFWISGVLLIIQAILLVFEKTRTGNISKNISVNQSKEEFLEGKNKKIIVLMLACVFLISLVVAQRSTTYLVYIHQIFTHLGYTGTSILFALNPILIVLFQTPLVTSFSEFNKILMVGIGIFLMGLGTFILAFTNTFTVAIISCIIYTVGEMISFSMAQLVIYQQMDEKKKGLGFGLYKTIYGLSTVVGPALGGAVYHQLGANMVWYLSGVIGLVCFVACIRYQKYD